jgi:CRISPR-associated endonuclease/helicase Cas3
MTFEEMFRSVHGYDPFPWQSKAARYLTENKTFSAVNVPTASGKTAMIDAAIYAAAFKGRRRIAFIIDRRVVVDEAFERAKRIGRALAENPILGNIAESLGPLQVVRLRGGVYGDEDWVLYPDRVTVLISTIDQVGSRLLHRGYGVSPRMAPLHAGFVGNDALYIVDEAHLSTPLVETVRATQGFGADIRLITMTATPVDRDISVQFSKEDLSNPILKKRLQAQKIATLISQPGNEDEFVKNTVSAANRLAKSARVIGVVVNRVSTARKIWKALKAEKKQAELLTGRIRPYDRDRLLERLLPDIQAGRTRTKGNPLFVVATQTIEVGADLDFDGLVTESAPLDALRQRFGRLDRLGSLHQTQGTIIHWPKFDDKQEELDDKIYGSAIKKTWKWLNKVSSKGLVDFGVSSIEKAIRQEKAPESELRHAPVLLPNHIKLLSQTGREAPALDVSPWLHGAQSGSADVSLIWRADLIPENPDLWEYTVSLRPPLNQEAMEIPVYAVRAWLEGLKIPELTDLEGIQFFFRPKDNNGKPILRWRGANDCQVISSKDILPGDTIILPATYGGCDTYGWDPKNTDPVPDIADYCSLGQPKDHVVRLVPALSGWLGEAGEGIIKAVSDVVLAETQVDPETGLDYDWIKSSHTTLRNLLADVDHPLIKKFQGRYEIELHPSGVVLRGGVIDEVDASLNSGVAVELTQHLNGVAGMVKVIIAEHPQAERIVQAALEHDRGKVESRFQTMLYGNPVGAAAGPMLAKSGLRKLSERRAAYKESGLPKGFRHELASLYYFDLEDQEDSDFLARYLIATHHGYGRPWFPECEDSQAPGAVYCRLESGWGTLFSELIEFHGPWKLANMELILRVADIRQSIKEQENLF